MEIRTFNILDGIQNFRNGVTGIVDVSVSQSCLIPWVVSLMSLVEYGISEVGVLIGSNFIQWLK